jgi:hypothetical protein
VCRMDNMDHDAKPKIDRAERMAQVVAAGGCSRNSLSHMCPLIISDPLQLLAGSSTLCTAGAINDHIFNRSLPFTLHDFRKPGKYPCPSTLHCRVV